MRSLRRRINKRIAKRDSGSSGWLVDLDWVGEGFAPDELNQLIVRGDAPMLAGRLRAGVDIEAGEEAVDALVRESAGAQDANLLSEEGIFLNRAGRAGGGWLHEFGTGNYGQVCRIQLGVRHLVRIPPAGSIPHRSTCVGRARGLSAPKQDPDVQLCEWVEPDTRERGGTLRGSQKFIYGVT